MPNDSQQGQAPICAHGQLRRSCGLCELVADNQQLKAEVARLTEINSTAHRVFEADINGLGNTITRLSQERDQAQAEVATLRSGMGVSSAELALTQELDTLRAQLATVQQQLAACEKSLATRYDMTDAAENLQGGIARAEAALRETLDAPENLNLLGLVSLVAERIAAMKELHD
jgi:chromosome segregation ATPase